jgi:hypothetical protein
LTRLVDSVPIRREGNTDVKRQAVILTLALALLASCGGGSGSETAPPPIASAPTGLWIAGGSTGAGLSAFKARATLMSAPFAAPVRADAASASSTYTLEASIDEHDILKFDEDVLAVAPSRTACCFVFAQANTEAANPTPSRSVKLYRTESSAARATLLSQIELQERESVEGLYLADKRLQALTSTSWYGTFGANLRIAPYWQSQQTRMVTYDLAVPTAPRTVSDLSIEGALVASRRDGDQILLVTRHTPVIAGFNPQPTTTAAVAGNQNALANIKDADVLPRISQNGNALDVLKLDNCYRQDPSHRLATTKLDGTIVTTLLSVSAVNGSVIKASCILEPITGVYVSSSSIVLTSVDSSSTKESTYVHLLRLRDHLYQGSARVDGALYSGGHADFRLSESTGVIRLVTTEFTQDPVDQFDHRLFTLKPSAAAPELDILATIPSAGETEIGKPNEDLYGVRFMTDRAYLVTFERTDPLYVLDLKDPARPKVAGSLEVPGLSDLLHPVSDALLLGVGRTGGGRAKVELYNVQSMSAPRSLGSFELGADYASSFSPAQFNRYAFTYLAGTSNDRFTLPYSAWRLVNDEMQSKSAIALFEISSKSTPDAARLQPVGEASLIRDSVDSSTRVLIHNDALYAWSGDLLYAGFWSNPETLAPQRN